MPDKVPVKYVRRDDLLGEAGMTPRPDYVLVLSALSMLLGALLISCMPLTAWHVAGGEPVAGEPVGRGTIATIFAFFLLGVWAVVAGLLTGYRVEGGRRALVLWSYAFVALFVGVAVVRISAGGVVPRQMRFGELACFLGFSVATVGGLMALPVCNIRHLGSRAVKRTFRSLRVARQNP